MTKAKVRLDRTCYIGLGSNQGDSQKLLSEAIRELDSLATTRLVGASRVYRTEPQGYKEQPWFFNQVARLESGLGALELLDQLQAIEAKLGRVRTERHFGPRNMDLDLLLFGDEIIAAGRLVVPHPRMRERAFMLVPLAELEPELRLPDGMKIGDLLGKLNYTLTGDKIRQTL